VSGSELHSASFTVKTRKTDTGLRLVSVLFCPTVSACLAFAPFTRRACQSPARESPPADPCIRGRGVDVRADSPYAVKARRAVVIMNRPSIKGSHVPSVHFRPLSVLPQGEHRAGVFHGLVSRKQFPAFSRTHRAGRRGGFFAVWRKVATPPAAPLNRSISQPAGTSHSLNRLQKRNHWS
jgi:hypothetical protein